MLKASLSPFWKSALVSAALESRGVGLSRTASPCFVAEHSPALLAAHHSPFWRRCPSGISSLSPPQGRGSPEQFAACPRVLSRCLP